VAPKVVPGSQSRWESAYLRFETPEQEIDKFQRRLRKGGASDWPLDAEIVELFCGRGNGLIALERLGFNRVEGVDLSPALLQQYRGAAQLYCNDCRHLPFGDSSKDVIIVQGGLHHLPELPGDLAQTLCEARRVLRPGGRFVAVEPWLTPFLWMTHAAIGIPGLRALWAKFDALAVMIEEERETYERWLSQPSAIRELLQRHFDEERCHVGTGKIMFLGRKE
jgi:SAM-dependent methyltransferase